MEIKPTRTFFHIAQRIKIPQPNADKLHNNLNLAAVSKEIQAKHLEGAKPSKRLMALRFTQASAGKAKETLMSITAKACHVLKECSKKHF